MTKTNFRQTGVGANCKCQTCRQWFRGFDRSFERTAVDRGDWDLAEPIGKADGLAPAFVREMHSRRIARKPVIHPRSYAVTNQKICRHVETPLYSMRRLSK